LILCTHFKLSLYIFIYRLNPLLDFEFLVREPYPPAEPPPLGLAELPLLFNVLIIPTGPALLGLFPTNLLDTCDALGANCGV
jgi:hypothetical protein